MYYEISPPFLPSPPERDGQGGVARFTRVGVVELILILQQIIITEHSVQCVNDVNIPGSYVTMSAMNQITFGD
jgi:hypothetical protein